MMTVISHRGYWKDPTEKNLPVAFKRSFDLGYGTETDLRDTPRAGKPEIVISHDMPRGGELSLRDLFAMVSQTLRTHPEYKLPLALNIKADGQALAVKELLLEFPEIDYYLFDMSVPDLIQCAAADLNCYTRVSEYEPVPSLYDHPRVSGIWLDAFTKIWYDEGLVRKFLRDGKKVALVSPDLHKRMDEFAGFLQWLVKTGLHKEQGLTICTDFPEDAAAVLHQS